MTYEDAKDKILEHLCPERRRKDEVSSEDLHALFDISPAMLNETVNQMIANGYLKRVPGKPTRVCLDSAGIAWCEKASGGSN